VTIVSFCTRTTVMVDPWLAAGYECWIVDVQHPRGVNRDGRLVLVGASVFELHPYHRWLPQGAVYAGFGFTPCTDLTFSGQRWRRENGPMATAEGFRLFAATWDLLRFYERERGARWAMENPKGIVDSWCKPDHIFHPWHYGDLESKETHLWSGGGFVMPPPSVTVKPADVKESCWKAAPGPERGDLRSVTPAGFAAAVFISNQPGFVSSARSLLDVSAEILSVE